MLSPWLSLRLTLSLSLPPLSPATATPFENEKTAREACDTLLGPHCDGECRSIASLFDYPQFNPVRPPHLFLSRCSPHFTPASLPAMDRSPRIQCPSGPWRMAINGPSSCSPGKRAPHVCTSNAATRLPQHPMTNGSVRAHRQLSCRTAVSPADTFVLREA